MRGMKETARAIVETYLSPADTARLLRDLKDGGYAVIEISFLKEVLVLLKKIEATKWD